MKLMMGLIALLLITISTAFDRNYYADELKITHKCFPTSMSLWNQNMESWFGVIESCINSGTLETNWNVKLAENVVGYGVEGDRLASIIYTNKSEEYVPSVETTKYSEQDANTYAEGMVAVMAYGMEGRVFLTATDDNCIHLATPVLTWTTRRAINSYHHMFPYIHVVESNDSWCFERP